MGALLRNIPVEVEMIDKIIKYLTLHEPYHIYFSPASDRDTLFGPVGMLGSGDWF